MAQRVAHRHRRRRAFRPLPRAQGGGEPAGGAGRALRPGRGARRGGRARGGRARRRCRSSAARRQRRADHRRPRRGAFRARRRRRCERGLHVLVEKPIAATLDAGRRSSPRWRGDRQPRAAGRPSAALLRRAPRDLQPHHPAALHRGDADRAVQAARHRRLGHPRPDDPRPRPGAGAGGQPDRERGRARRRGVAARTRTSPTPACASPMAAWRPSPPAGSR